MEGGRIVGMVHGTCVTSLKNHEKCKFTAKFLSQL